MSRHLWAEFLSVFGFCLILVVFWTIIWVERKRAPKKIGKSCFSHPEYCSARSAMLFKPDKALLAAVRS